MRWDSLPECFLLALLADALNFRYRCLFYRKHLDTYVEVIGQAKKENQHTFQAFHGLAEARPDGCGFADLKIGSDNPENAKKSLEYIQLTAVAGNELIFQQFRENLAEDSFFTSPSINSISADTTSGFKVARMTIAKGEDKE